MPIQLLFFVAIQDSKQVTLLRTVQCADFRLIVAPECE
jgi:hypothetical protein